MKNSHDLGPIELHLDELLEAAITISEKELSSSTKRSIHIHWTSFEEWCEKYDLPPLPTNEHVYSLYMTYLLFKGNTVHTLRKKIQAINWINKNAGFNSPYTVNVKKVWAEIVRIQNGVLDHKLPLILEILRLITRYINLESLSGKRDRAIILIGYYGSLRRSELSNLTFENIHVSENGLTIVVFRNNNSIPTETVQVHYSIDENNCPVRSFYSWKEASGLKTGPVFRSINLHGHISEKKLSDKSVALILKKYLAVIGVDDYLFSGHSIRSGLTVSALINSELNSIAQKRHRPNNKLLRRYNNSSDNLFSDNAAKDIGL
jgi:Site-specific recombinase XerD